MPARVSSKAQDKVKAVRSTQGDGRVQDREQGGVVELELSFPLFPALAD